MRNAHTPGHGVSGPKQGDLVLSAWEFRVKVWRTRRALRRELMRADQDDLKVARYYDFLKYADADVENLSPYRPWIKPLVVLLSLAVLAVLLKPSYTKATEEPGLRNQDRFKITACRDSEKNGNRYWLSQTEDEELQKVPLVMGYKKVGQNAYTPVGPNLLPLPEGSAKGYTRGVMLICTPTLNDLVETEDQVCQSDGPENYRVFDRDPSGYVKRRWGQASIYAYRYENGQFIPVTKELVSTVNTNLTATTAEPPHTHVVECKGK